MGDIGSFVSLRRSGTVKWGTDVAMKSRYSEPGWIAFGKVDDEVLERNKNLNRGLRYWVK